MEGTTVDIQLDDKKNYDTVFFLIVKGGAMALGKQAKTVSDKGQGRS